MFKYNKNIDEYEHHNENSIVNFSVFNHINENHLIFNNIDQDSDCIDSVCIDTNMNRIYT